MQKPRLQSLSSDKNPKRAENFPANASYSAMVELILLLIGLGVAVTVENPLNSLFWLTSFMLKLFDKYLGYFTVLQHCMHGGTRDKKSKFWSYNPRKLDANILESLGIMCVGQHQHASLWKYTLPCIQWACATFPACNWHGGYDLMFLTIRLNRTLEMMQNDVETSEFEY